MKRTLAVLDGMGRNLGRISWEDGDGENKENIKPENVAQINVMLCHFLNGSGTKIC